MLKTLLKGNGKMKETVIQFGTGNFLRGFFDHFLHILNENGLYEGKAVIVQPTSGKTGEIINAQGGKDEELLELIVSVAGGKETQNEINGYREIAIFKDGVTL